MSKIPKIIHQLWIGDKPCPQILMNTWKEKHPEFEYIFWNEEEIKKREFIFVNQNKIDEMVEINGKADIMRWEILEKMGGIFIDADSITDEVNFCSVKNKKAVAGMVGIKDYNTLNNYIKRFKDKGAMLKNMNIYKLNPFLNPNTESVEVIINRI